MNDDGLLGFSDPYILLSAKKVLASQHDFKVDLQEEGVTNMIIKTSSLGTFLISNG